MPRTAVGRSREAALIDRALAEGRSRAIAVELVGEAGIGKTVVFEAALERAHAAGAEVLEVRCAEAEAELGLVGFTDLLPQLPASAVDRLAPPQRHALDVAMLRVDPQGAPPDARTIAVATLAALREASEAAPVVLAVDDRQWLDRDSARIASFVTRRLRDEAVTVLTTARSGEPTAWEGAVADGVESVAIEPLDQHALGQMLREERGHAFDLATVSAIHEAAGGNPLFALELARAAESAGTRSIRDPIPVPEGVEHLLAGRIRSLPEDARWVTLIAALARRASVEMVERACGADVAAGALDLCREAEITDIRGGVVTFTHPLLRSVAVSLANPAQRARAHEALATASEDDEERVWHRANASVGADESLARDLLTAAERVWARGAPARAAELAELAEEFTAEAEREGLAFEVAHDAAWYLSDAGDLDRSKDRYRRLIDNLPHGWHRADALYHLSSLSWNNTVELRATAERALEDADDDPHTTARVEHLLAWAEVDGGSLDSAAELAARAVAHAQAGGNPMSIGLVAAAPGWIAFLRGEPTWRATLEEAASTGRSAEDFSLFPTADLLHGKALVCADRLDEAGGVLAAAESRLRAQGRSALLAYALLIQADRCVRGGMWDEVGTHLDEAEMLESGIDDAPHAGDVAFARALVDGLKGRTNAARAHAEAASTIAERFGYRALAVQAAWAAGFAALTSGDSAVAREAMDPLPDIVAAMGVVEPGAFPFIADLGEALLHTGSADRAVALASELIERGRALDRPTAIATGLRVLGMVRAAEDDLSGALEALGEALDAHARSPVVFEAARTRIVVGETLRRAGARKRAREELSVAFDELTRLGAPQWADRARRELGRIGGRRPATADAADPAGLSARERDVLRLLAEGKSNAEIAEALYLSTRTVERHISNLYAKVGARGSAARTLAAEYAHTHHLL